MWPYLLVLILLSSCSTVNLNCNYYKLVGKELKQVCVQELPSGELIDRTRDR